MDESGTPYGKVLGVTRAYLGPTSERFINRQISQRFNKKPEDLVLEDVPALAVIIRQKIYSLTGDSTVADEFKNKLLGIGKDNVLQKSIKAVTATGQADYSNLRERIKWYVELRWGFLVLLGVTATVPLLAVNGYTGTVPTNIKVLTIGMSINLFFSALFIRRKYGKNFYLVLAIAQLLTDIGLASILVFLNGGLESRAVIVYAIPIMMSGVLLGTAAVYIAGLLSITSYTTLIILDHLGVIKPENIANLALHSNLTYLLRTLSFYPAVLLVLTIISVVVVNAISAKERLELEVKGLGAEKARVDAILKSMGSALVTINNDEKIELVNDAFESLTGWKRSEVIGRNLDDMLPLLDETGQRVRYEEQPMLKLLSGTDPAHIPKAQHVSQFQYQRKDQSVFPFIGTLAPIVIRGRLIGAITVFDDATDIKQVQTLKTNFIALASHQLKTPVTEIKSTADLLLDGMLGKLNAKQTKFIKQIYDVSDHAAKLVSDLLDISILEKNKVGLNLKKTELSATIKDVASIYGDRVKQKGLKLKIVERDPELVLLADGPKLVEVIGNLISNAIKYAPKGTITIETMRDGSYGMITVSDEGHGLSETALNHIFKKEETLPGTAIAEAGSGLGLYLSKQLVVLQGGSIGLLSTSKSGTSIYIKIPLAKEAEDKAEAPS